MALNEYDQARVRDYLLGRLSEDEREEIEERLMVEDDLFEELEISTGELIEEYREGELTAKERQSFESSVLSSPEGRKRHVFAAAIDMLEQRRQPQAAGLLERVWAIFRKPQWAIPITGLAVVIIAVIIFWPRPSGFVAVTLTSSAVTRSTEDRPPAKITIPADTSELRVTLALPEPAPPDIRYRVKLLEHHRDITNLQPSGQDANSVSVVIPARQVPPGSYALVIYAIKSDGTEQQIPGNYFFTIS